MQKLPTAALLALSGISTLNAHADTKLEEMVITSSRVETPLREVAASVSVITLEDIELRGFASVADVLRFEPGISVANNGGIGKATSVRIRGEKGFRTKAYIDGIDVTDTSSTQAGPNFANMLTSGIERIEVIRGPEGLIYGADAGGVINMYTARPQEGLAGGIDVEGGRYGTGKIAGHINGGSEVVDGALSAERFETDGFNTLTTDTTTRDDDGYKNTTLHGRAGWNITDKFRAEIVGRTVDGKSDFDNCFTPDFERSDTCKNEYDQDAGRVALVHNDNAFSNTLSFNVNKTDRKSFTDGVNDFSTKGKIETINYLGNWEHSDPFKLVYGAEFEKSTLDSGETDEKRDQEGYFLEYQGAFMDRLYVTAGARYTDNEDFGTKTTYRTGASYIVPAGDGEIKFKGIYGTGFRAPSLFEIAYNIGPDAFPPALGTELGAEESKGFDFGAGYYATSGWYAEATYFDQKIDDEIYFDLIDFSGYLQGDGDSSSKGVEVVSEVPVGDMVSLRGNYTYTDTQDFAGEQRLRAPKHMSNFGVLVTPMDGRLEINLNYRLARDTAEESSGKVDDYDVLDLSISYQVIDALQVYGRIDNLTDEDYEEIPTYNTQGVAGYAGLRYRF